MSCTACEQKRTVNAIAFSSRQKVRNRLKLLLLLLPLPKRMDNVVWALHTSNQFISEGCDENSSYVYLCIQILYNHTISREAWTNIHVPN
jgi:hypothetical protein